jgi:hypothetical protein
LKISAFLQRTVTYEQTASTRSEEITQHPFARCSWHIACMHQHLASVTETFLGQTRKIYGVTRVLGDCHDSLASLYPAAGHIDRYAEPPVRGKQELGTNLLQQRSFICYIAN